MKEGMKQEQAVAVALKVCGKSNQSEGHSDPFADASPAGQASDQIALPGPEGARAEELLRAAREQGVETLGVVTRQALRRLLAGGSVADGQLLTDAERQQLAAALAAVTASADLLGRTRIREHQRRALRGRKDYAEGAVRPFAAFQEPPAILPPRSALEYFLRLEPLIGVDPGRFSAQMEKQAFQLAVATEETLLDRIQKAIAERLESGEVNEGPQAVQELLDAAGVTVPNSGYSNAVFRTAAVDAYNTGAWNEYQDVAEEFPVYEYTNPVDTRSRPHHAAKNGQYYSSKTPFAQVRGEGPENEINCVLPGAWVQGRVGQALKAWYAGQAIEVRTRRGHCLAVTVQHPVLTENGFVPAGQLQQGDYLTCYGGDDEVAAEGKDIEDTPALIEEVFGALQAAR